MWCFFKHILLLGVANYNNYYNWTNAWNLYNKKQKGSRIVFFENGKIVKKGSYEF